MALELVSKLPYDHPYRWDGTLFGGPKLWRPDELGTDLALWLDAEDTASITLNGSDVSQWDDKSGNNRHASQATAVSQPAYDATGMLGKPAVDWGTVANSKVLTHAISGYAPQRYFGVAEWDGPDPFNNFAGLVTHGPVAGIVTADRIMVNTSGTGWFGALLYYLNGGAASSTALPTISSPFVFATNFGPQAGRTGLFVGNDVQPPLGRSWLGKISEIIAINFVPTTQERQRLEGYLAWKWGLEANLPVDHPYKTTPPTV